MTESQIARMMERGKICGGRNMQMDRTSASTTCTRVAHFLYSCPGFTEWIAEGGEDEVRSRDGFPRVR
jgi:hypothetical protein